MKATEENLELTSSGKRGLMQKFVLGLFFVAALMVFITSLLIGHQAAFFRYVVAETTRNHLMSSAQALVHLVTAEELDRFKTPEDTLDPLYDEIRKRLVQFAEDHNLVYAYFWRLYDENTNQLQFIMSNDMNPETQIGPEVLFFESEEMTISALAGEVGANDLGDYIPEWYGLISGWAPVFDADGNLRAVAAVDVSDEYILALYRNVRNITVAQIALFFVTLISGIFNLLLYRRKTIEVVQANIRVSNEKMIVQTMQDNINQGIFIMDEELKILPNYSKPLIPILSYYDSELAGKNFLDILVGSLDTKQLQAMKGYFAMIFAKSKSAKILESVNPIYEFEYKVGDLTKILTTKFSLIEQKDAAPVVLAVIVDISKEREFEKEIQVQKDLQQQEVKNLFDVIQIDPAVFQDFIEDTESNFNYINSILKDKSLTEKQVITKFFQNVHAIKSNALILGLESFGKKLHILEEDIKAALAAKTINEDSVLSLAIKLETIMQEKDAYVKTIKKIESYKASHKLDSVFLYSLTKAVENISAETQKKVELKTVEMNLKILESNLRKPIKDILFQCLRNSIYHGIELPEERIKKNKKPAGLLTVSIKNVDNNAEVIFSDDGQGLDYEKIKNKYLMLNPDAKDTSNKVLLAAIFSPEFSTAGETTSVAGRGVGLSLVKDIVKKNKGTINVNSSESGVTFKFILPLAG